MILTKSAQLQPALCRVPHYAEGFHCGPHLDGIGSATIGAWPSTASVSGWRISAPTPFRRYRDQRPVASWCKWALQLLALREVWFGQPSAAGYARGTPAHGNRAKGSGQMSKKSPLLRSGPFRPTSGLWPKGRFIGNWQAYVLPCRAAFTDSPRSCRNVLQPKSWLSLRWRDQFYLGAG
jgi:hypothetical protein